MGDMEWQSVEKPPPHDGPGWVMTRVEIQRVADGVVRVYNDDCGRLDDDGSLATFIWEDGNYSCDCNRHLFFCRAVDDDEGEPACSDGRYRVNIYNPVDGTCHYREFPDA